MRIITKSCLFAATAVLIALSSKTAQAWPWSSPPPDSAGSEVGCPHCGGTSNPRSNSLVLDVDFYLMTYGDLRNAFGNNRNAAKNHWLTYGIKEGRRSSAVFDVQYYLGKYPDLQNAFGAANYSAAVDHWLKHGVSEGRQGSSDFDPRFYLSNNPDVAQAYGAGNYKGAIEHYLTYGRNEGRRGTP